MKPQQTRSIPGDKIDKFEDLMAREQALNEFVVLDTSTDQNTAHRVNTRELTCGGMDDECRSEGAEVCRHVAAALAAQPRQRSVEQALLGDMASIVRDLNSMLSDAEDVHEQINAGLPKLRDAEAGPAKQPERTSGNRSNGQKDWDGNPVKEIAKKMVEADLDPDDFRIFVDDDFGSLQIETNAYLDEDTFEDWVNFKDAINMGYDKSNDRNYLPPDRFPEVFGE